MLQLSACATGGDAPVDTAAASAESPPAPPPDEVVFSALKKRSMESGKEAALVDYIATNPDSRFLQEARETVDLIRYRPYLRENTAAGYAAFIAAYPENVNVPEARLRADELVFAPFAKEGSVDGYARFLQQFPNNLLAPAAQAAVEDFHFEEVKKANTLIGYAEFLHDHATSERAIEVRILKDQLEFEPYQKKDEEEGYREFLRGYPLNHNREKAFARMMELRTARVREEVKTICAEAALQGNYRCEYVSYEEGTLHAKFVRPSETDQGLQLLMGGPGYAEELQRRYSSWKNETIKRLLRILGVMTVTVEGGVEPAAAPAAPVIP